MTILWNIAAALILTLPITTRAYYSRQNLPGAALCFALATAAWFIGQALPIVGSAVAALLLGMLLANFWPLPASFRPGIKDTGKRVLQTAVVLFGFQMNLTHVLSLGSQALLLVGITIATALLLALVLGRVFGTTENERILVGVGTAICGGSAIAATAPIIKADSRELSTAISTIFLFNVLAVFVYPLAGHLLQMSDLAFGMWAGAAINDTSSVVAAGYAYSDTAGNTATVVKLTRTLMIIPITFMLALRQSKRESVGSGFSLRQTFPWFVLGFVLACLANTTGLIAPGITAFWGQMGKFFMVAALAAIGLSTNIRELLRQGSKALLLGLCCALAVALISLAAIALLQIN